MPSTSLTLTALTRTCSACPEQYEGKLADGRVIYLRHRHGVGSVAVGSTLDDAVMAGWPIVRSDGRVLLEWIDDDWGGCLRPGSLPHILYLAGIDTTAVADQIVTDPDADDFIQAAAELGIHLEAA